MKNICKAIWIISCIMVIVPGCQSIDIDKFPQPIFHKINPAASNVRFSILITADLETRENLMYDGGSFWTKRKMVHTAILVEHPKGSFLYDSGLGKNIDQQFEAMPWWASSMLAYNKTRSAYEQLSNAKYDLKQIKYIIPSHLHWDHASGLPDFPDTPVLIHKPEYDFAQSEAGKPPAFIKSQYNIDAKRWQFFNYQSGPYENFHASHDLFGDGSVVLVPLPGHTIGSTGMFLNLKSGKRFLFIGDLTWSIDGIKKPATKHFLSTRIVDQDRNQTSASIVKVHYLHKKYPDLKILPAHDFKPMQKLKTYPGFEE